jgi:hypothetical protein
MKPERFRPVVERPTNIEIFRKMLAGASAKEPQQLSLALLNPRRAGAASGESRVTPIPDAPEQASSLPLRAKT